MILILHTTRYREGGQQFTRAAHTLAAEKKAAHAEVRVEAVESKKEVRELFDQIKAEGKFIDELHFIGHSGMYGPMFGTRTFPEQFSPWEWEQLEIPFAEKAKAFFVCCRSARWFAPFFARTFGVTTHGYHWYTTFSRRKDRFKWDGFKSKSERPLYSIGCPGKKSHGWRGSLRKYLGIQKAEDFKVFEAEQHDTDRNYNKVAALYDAVFQDIRVRRHEWTWLQEHLPKNKPAVLDIGCGNGALLRALGNQISEGHGVDITKPLLELARNHPEMPEHIHFTAITGPQLPFPDNTFDCVTSLLSFRYLDWDPLMAEIRRVLKPDGRFLVIDMVTAPVKFKEMPRLVHHQIKARLERNNHPTYKAALQKLVSHPDWKQMLQYNPIRSEHEMKWYLESRFPPQKAELINIGWNARILAFDSGPVGDVPPQKLSYP